MATQAGPYIYYHTFIARSMIHTPKTQRHSKKIGLHLPLNYLNRSVTIFCNQKTPESNPEMHLLQQELLKKSQSLAEDAAATTKSNTLSSSTSSTVTTATTSKSLTNEQKIDNLFLPRQEVIRRLHLLKQPITLFGEDDDARLERLKYVLKAGLFEVDGDMTKGQTNDFLRHIAELRKRQNTGILSKRKRKDSEEGVEDGEGGVRDEELRGYDLFQSTLQVIKCPEIVEDDIQEKDLEEHVHTIRSMLGSMDDGNISISAYDTAWVALVEDIHGNGAPQFPSSLRWIANNQLPDGSWGDCKIFSAHDRLINTLACVVALKSWNVHQDKCEKGMSFFKENISKLENENDEHMPVGFEVAFPSLLEVARSLGIELADHSPVLQEIYAKRSIKLTRISRDIMHKMPTTLLYSLEGMPHLDWEKLLKLQSQDGSFAFSPSSTAYALIKTKNEKCWKYLTRTVQRFNGGVPNVYPVDLFERTWAVDRLQRLGISRYFQPEIRECMDYVYRHWTEEGICWARNSEVYDIDDTSMGFRLLRLHGYEVSSDVFKHFKKGDEFFCIAGQTSQAITGIYNLYRASQLLFPEEKILDDAMQFAAKFLREKQSANQLLDKWIITKDLPGEVGFALAVPWYASLPRVETRLYIEQYGGEDDVWIGKTLYRMPCVNNEVYLELAKLDYNKCQAVHQIEWERMKKWYNECKLENLGTSTRSLLLAYFVAAASIYEPERSQERIGWAKTAVLVETISSYFQKEKDSGKQKRAFVNEFRNCINGRDYVNGRSMEPDKIGHGFTRILLGTLNHLSLEAMVAQGRDISHHLRHAWEKWLMKWQAEGDRYEGESELLVQIINLIAGRWLSEELLSHPQYGRVSDLTKTICHKLGHCQKQKVHDKCSDNNADSLSITTLQIESEMKQLVQLVLQNSKDGIASDIKQTFLTVAKSFYYTAYCDPQTINFHIDKVLFQRVD